MEVDPTRVCELLVGLPDVVVLGVLDERDAPLVVHVETRDVRPSCSRCSGAVVVKDRRSVELVDLPCFGRTARLVWRKRRWSCRDAACTTRSWTEDVPAIAASRRVMTDRAGRWVTEQVGRHGRTVNEVAGELGCDWHTVNDTVIAYGTALIDDPDRIGEPTALGLDETLFVRVGPRHHQSWSTSIVDVRAGRLLDVVPGRSSAEPCQWLAERSDEWRANIAWATLDLSGPYRSVFDTMLPDAVQVADPFHVVKLANTKLDECRRRVQNETLGHRGRKDDPLYRCRRLLTEPTNDSTPTAARSCSACSRLAIRAVRCARHGMQRKSSGQSTNIAIPAARSSSSTGSGATSKTSPARSRCVRSVAP